LAHAALKHRLELLRAIETEDAMGRRVKTWAPIATVWAERVQLGVSERIVAGQVAGSATVLFRIRWSATWASLDPTDRVRCAGRTYDIKPPVEPDRVRGEDVKLQRWLEITATARAERRV